MKTGFYFKLAASNIRKNARTYVPYMLTCVMTIMMFYIMKSLSVNPGLSSVWGAQMVTFILGLGVWVIAVFSAIFLFYTNSFLIKNRKKEFGVFNILGMEKRHIAGVILIETLYISVITLALGLGFGILLDKLMYMTISRLIGGEVKLGFFISGEAIGTTVLIFVGIYALILIRSIFMIQLSNPIELLRGGKVGEKEPKAKWFSAVLGLVFIGIGYYISITTDNPLSVMTLFFFAVLLVIFGTYLLFTSGSIAFLKLLKKNKNYYYKTRHFISVSGMIYRMKQNAVGLANICVLSTMVLVMVSSTTSLIIGMEDIINSRYTSEFNVNLLNSTKEDSERLINEIHAVQADNNFKAKNESVYSDITISAFRQDNKFLTGFENVDIDINMMSPNMVFPVIITLDDYNKILNQNKTLSSDEILMYYGGNSFEYPTLEFFGKEYKIAEQLDTFYDDGETASYVFDVCYIVVSDNEVFTEINKTLSEAMEKETLIQYSYSFDLGINENEQLDFYNILLDKYRHDPNITIESKADGRESFMVLYGGLFFLGMFLGTLFTMATALIIYYKQISEGFDDRERFGIMKKVGLNRNEIKSAVHSQILTVFFMPLVVAGIHLSAAFPLISRLLFLLNMTNTKLYIFCTAGSFLVFGLVYVVIYFLTSKAYYRLVNEEN